MDWTQTLAIIATLIGATFTFFKLTRDEISVIREDMKLFKEDMKRMDNLHREDMKAMDARWEERWSKSEDKWERLFERLLIQDQQKNK